MAVAVSSRWRRARLLLPVGRWGPRRGASLCYAIISLTVMLVLGLLFLQLGLNSAHWAYRHYRDQQAFYLAEATSEHAVWMMQQSASGVDNINDALDMTDAEAQAGSTRTYQSPTWTIGGGAYRFRAVVPYKGIPGTIQLFTTGISPKGAREDVLVVLKEDRLPDVSHPPIPALCFRHAVFADHNLTISGNPEVRGHPELGGAGVYANGNISLTGNPTVYGPVAAVGNITVTGNLTQIPGDAGLYAHAPRQTMPLLDLAYYRSIADETWGSGGTVSRTGNITSPLGTPEDPKIIYVDGTLKLTGNVTLTGYGIIVASKGITVGGNVLYGSPGTGWGLLTAGSFKVTGTADIYGSVYCHSATSDAEFFAAGTANIYGGVVADVVNFRGDYMVEWDGAANQMVDMPGTIIDHGPPIVDPVGWKRHSR